MGQTTLTKVTVSLPSTLVKWAKHRAVDEGRTFQDVVAEALDAFKKGASR